MKKILKAIILGISIIIIGANAEAKNYYSMEYNSFPKNFYPYKNNSNNADSKIDVDDYYSRSSTLKKDFNRDGKKEKVQLLMKNVKNSSKTMLEVKINGRIKIKKIVSGFCMNASFKTYHLQGRCIAVLIHGDEDYAGGNAFIFTWKKNNRLVFLKSHQANGYLDVFVGKDKRQKKRVLYIMDHRQLFNHYGKKWPKYIQTKYKKYASIRTASVTKIEYAKYILKKGRLKKKATDYYYSVGEAYD